MTEFAACYEALGFRESPFSITPDTSLFFPNPAHIAALNHMQYGLESGSFTLITGEVGLGKTLLCRELMRKCPGNIHTAYIFNPMQNAEDLLRSIHLDLTGKHSDASSKATLHDEIYRALLKIAEQGGRTAIIIDEVHCLKPEVLESLRLISNLETEKQKLLSFILVGQPEIKKLLAKDALRALAQRICISYTLEPMNFSTSCHYINHRVNNCHTNKNFRFSNMAMFWIHHYSKGIPRRINQICERAILAAYAKSRTYISASIAISAAKEVIKI